MKPRFYRPELDTLRFFAFFAVFLHHVIPNNAVYFSSHGAPSWLAALVAATASAGAFGVDLFFLLSAFLITELLLREREHTGQLNVRAFYIRRILRIWPLYFLLITIASLLPLLDAHESFDWRYKLGFLFLSGNWVCSAVGYPNSIAAPLWSVSIEEQFYLLWPNAVRRASKTTIMAIAGSLVVVAWVARVFVVSSRSSHPALWCNTLCRLDNRLRHHPRACISNVAAAVACRRESACIGWGHCSTHCSRRTGWDFKFAPASYPKSPCLPGGHAWLPSDIPRLVQRERRASRAFECAPAPNLPGQDFVRIVCLPRSLHLDSGKSAKRTLSFDCAYT